MKVNNFPERTQDLGAHNQRWMVNTLYAELLTMVCSMLVDITNEPCTKNDLKKYNRSRIEYPTQWEHMERAYRQRPWGEVIECILMRPTRLQRNWWHEGAWSSMATVKFRLCAGKKKYQIQFESRVGINRLSLADWKQHRAAAPANLEKNKQWKPFCIHHSVCVSHPDAFFAVFSLFFCSFARSNNGQRHTPHIQPRLRQNGFDFWIMS